MFFKKERNENNDLSKVAALLIHAAKIDENFSKSEEIIIKQALLQIGVKDENFEKGIVKFLVDVYDNDNETVMLATILTMVKKNKL